MFSLFGADVVPPVALPIGRGLISLLDMAEHLVVELVAERSKVGGEGFSVGIFSVQVGGDVGTVFVAEPGIVVAEGDAVEDGLLVVFSGDGLGGASAFSHGNFKCSGVEDLRSGR